MREVNKRKIISFLTVIFTVISMLTFSIMVSIDNASESGEAQNVETFKDDLQVHFLNVYNGDCVFVKFADTEILIDSGDKNNSNKTEINNKIKELCTDKKLEYIFVTHGDADHLEIMTDVFDFFNKKRVSEFNTDEKWELFLEGYSVGEVIDFDSEFVAGLYSSNDESAYKKYQKSRDALVTNTKTKHKVITDFWDNKNTFKNVSIELPQNSKEETAKLHILYNEYYFLTEEQRTEEYKNTTSICLCVEYGKSKVLLTGDLEEVDTTENPIEFKGETKLLANYKKLLENGVTLFKAGHHGSRSSNSEKFIDAIHPKYVMISCQAMNTGYKFPSQLALNNFFKYTGNIYITSYYNETGGMKDVYYGSTSFYMDKEENVTVSCENKEMQNVKLQDDTKWFKTHRTVPTSIIEIAPDGKENGNCTLIKTGAIELLYNAGVYEKEMSRSFIDDIEKYCTDGIIEYVIVANNHLDNITQMVGTTTYDEEEEKLVYNNDGIFDLFKIGTLIDFGTKTNISLSDSAICKTYSEMRAKLEGTNYISASQCDTTPFKLYDFTGEDRDVYFQILNSKAYKEAKFRPTDENNYSVPFLLTIGSYKALFTGDLNNTDGSEDYLVKNNNSLLGEGTIDLYKLPNHGFSSSKKESTSTTESILKLLKSNCTVLMNGVCGTNYSGVTSGTARFPNQYLIDDIFEKTENVYPTMCFDGNDFVQMYGTVTITLTSVYAEAMKSPVISWQNATATEATFENWLDTFN